MKFIEIIKTIQQIVDSHPNIDKFYTGLGPSANFSDVTYPCLRLLTDTHTFSNNLDNNTQTHEFTLTLLANELEIEVAPEVFKKIHISSATQPQNGAVDDQSEVYSNLLKEKCIQWISHVVAALDTFKPSNRRDFFRLNSAEFVSLNEYTKDACIGVSMQISLTVANSYKCEYPSMLILNTEHDHLQRICPEPPVPLRYSMDYNGIDRYGTISQTTNAVFNIDWQQPLTFETWYFHVPGQTMYFYGKINTSAGHFFSSIGSRNVLRLQIRNTSPFNLIDVYSKGTISAGWNHIVITHNGNGGAEYDVQFTINNVQSALPNDWGQGSQLTGGTNSNTALAETGRLAAFNAYGIGTVAHMRLWRNVELTSTEITTLYNGGKVLYDNVPQSNSLMFDTGFADENHGWYGSTGWLMQELSGNSNFLFGRNSSITDRNNNIPS